MDTESKIEALLNYSYDRTIERINAIEDATNPHRSIVFEKDNYPSFLMGYANYYCGCFEGVFFIRFLDEFNRMPSPTEAIFIKEAILSKFEALKEITSKLGDKKYDYYKTH